MTPPMNKKAEAKDAAQAADLLVTVATTLNERLLITAEELARSQTMLREASEELMTAFRGAADRIVAAQHKDTGEHAERTAEYGVVLDHLYRAVQHLQSHDLVNQLIDAQKLRVDKMREKLGEALSLAGPPVPDPQHAEQWIERSRQMLDCIVAGIQQIDDDAYAPKSDKKRAGSVDLF
jgi:response regulator RpfG family c-di-GMP phosphodiesterase